MKKLVKKVRKFVESESGVSPVVATLVLIVVAVAGAVAVGTITGTFASDTATQANVEDVSESSKVTLLVGGSTTVQPLSEKLAEAFMKEKPGIKIEVQGGGSGAGMTGVGEGILDIGASSEFSKVESALRVYPDLKYFEIGGSAVVVIANGLSGNITKNALKKIFEDRDGKVGISDSNNDGLITDAEVDNAGTAFRVFQRQDPGGTEETFAQYAVGKKTLDEFGAEGRIGNAGVLEAVRATANSIGFVDYGFTKGVSGINILGIDGDNDGMQATDIQNFVDFPNTGIEKTIKDALKANAKLGGGSGLTRHLYYVTKGEPDILERAFIEFALSPGAVKYFQEVGYFSIYDYKTV